MRYSSCTGQTYLHIYCCYTLASLAYQLYKYCLLQLMSYYELPKVETKNIEYCIFVN